MSAHLYPHPYLHMHRRARRHALFALVVAMHMLALFWWPRHVQAPPGGDAREAIDIVFARPISVPPIEDPIPPRRPVHPRAAQALTAQVPVQREPQAITATAPEVVPDTAPLAPEAAPIASPADGIRSQALAGVGKIDKELRKASLTMSERTLSYRAGALERGIAAAHRQVGPPKIEEMIMPDGRRMSRIGNNCAYMESNALTHGRDVMQKGVRTVWARCDFAH